MRNILMTVITVLITALIIIIMIKGLTIGKIQVLSVAQIKENAQRLDAKIEDLNTLKNVTYKKKVAELDSSIKKLTSNKQEYLDLASVSTDSEIKEANREQTYTREFLWNKVGSYATREGVNLKWEVTPNGTYNKYTLNFTAVGSYIGIINYVYALENDSELEFKIENFKIVSGATAEQLSATFSVANIGIKQESTSTQVKTTTTTSTDKKDNNQENANTESSKENKTTTNDSNQIFKKDTVDAGNRIDAAVSQ